MMGHIGREGQVNLGRRGRTACLVSGYGREADWASRRRAKPATMRVTAIIKSLPFLEDWDLQTLSALLGHSRDSIIEI
jgi:hypothetical protein